ncbi:hypothetical protein [Streptomyces scabiei]|uniref:hypothetical protein n=1 Tax=Streptomyces scabiei TaxID=1930 RepID=UPI0038F72E00
MSRRSPSQQAAATHMQARRRRLKALGQWQPYVDAGPAREHLKKINATGMPVAAVCERLGLPHASSLQPLLWGRGSYGPAEKVRRETAELVLSYWPRLEDFPDSALIDATGTRRRVQALAVRGWSRNWIGQQVGMRPEHFRKAITRDRVTAALARSVAAVYDARWNQDPTDHGISLNAASRVRADAARSGCHSALAWDDDTIDDPSAVPLTDACEPAATEGGNLAARWLMGESVILDLQARKEVLAHLYEWTNDTPQEIADKLGMTFAAADRAWERMKEKAARDGRRLWRRVYVARDRDLKKNEMEEAA